MTQKHAPILFFLALLLISSLACSTFSTPAVVDSSAQIAQLESRLATAEAQLAITQRNNNESLALNPTNSDGQPELISNLEQSLINLYAQANPSVVHIFSSSNGFGLGTGSGFVYDTDGHIITNNHVVEEADAIEIVFANGSRRSATIIGRDVDSDLAVIKVNSLPAGAVPLPLGNSNDIVVGQISVAIGNPFGEQSSMSMGVISGLGRSISSQRQVEGGGRYTLPQVIQTDAPINPGNSGGPLLNLNGEVIGVNSAIRTETGVNSGVGFSIPVNAVRRIAPALIAEGIYHYPFIGVQIGSLDLMAQESLGLSQVNGAYVSRVTPNSPASNAGIIGAEGPGGDLIVAINNQPVNGPDDLISYLVFETEVGQIIKVTLIRDNETITVPLTLGERP